MWQTQRSEQGACLWGIDCSTLDVDSKMIHDETDIRLGGRCQSALSFHVRKKGIKSNREAETSEWQKQSLHLHYIRALGSTSIREFLSQFLPDDQRFP